jgi:putative N6-adenine-specific DNA methylase
MHGMEGILSWELGKIGATNIQILRRAVTFEGDMELLYRANYELRTALRIMIQTYTFKAEDPTELYNQAKEIAWEKHLGLDQTLAVDCTVSSDLFPHSKYASLKLKDAIVDRFREKFGRRPDVDPKRPDLQLNLFIQGDQCYISVDSSGDSLHIRGYRNSGHLSPLNEVLAAGMIVLSGWTKDKVLWDPMCGSGSLVIEAAMLASNTPAGICREDYAFMRWNDFDEKLWEKVKKEALAKIDKTDVRIKAGDISGIHVRMTRSSAELVGLEDCITYECADFFECKGEGETLIMNPPYGERLEHEDIIGFYVAISDNLKMDFTGSDCWMISSNNEALKSFSLRPSKKTVLYNGALECLFQKFELYDGSRKGELVEKAASYSDAMWPDPDDYRPMKLRVIDVEEPEENSRGRGRDDKGSRDTRGSRDDKGSRDTRGSRDDKGSREDRGGSRDRGESRGRGADRSDSKRSHGPGGFHSESGNRRSTPTEGPKPERDRTYRPPSDRKREGDRGGQKRTWSKEGDGSFNPKTKWQGDPDRAFKQRSEWKKDDTTEGAPKREWKKDGEKSTRPKGDWNKGTERTFKSGVDPKKSGDRPPYRKEGESSFKKDFKKSGDRPYKKEGESSFKKDFKKSGDRPYRKEGESSFKKDFKKSGDRPYKKDGDSSFKKDFKKSGDRPYKKEGESSFKKSGDRPYKKDGESSFKKDFKKRDDKPAYKKDGERPPFRKDSDAPRSPRPERPRDSEQQSSPKKEDAKGGGFKDKFLKAGKKKGEE